MVWSTCRWAVALSIRSICTLCAHRLFLYGAVGAGRLDGQSSEAAAVLSRSSWLGRPCVCDECCAALCRNQWLGSCICTNNVRYGSWLAEQPLKTRAWETAIRREALRKDLSDLDKLARQRTSAWPLRGLKGPPPSMASKQASPPATPLVLTAPL
ncbi:hypothetical protein M440DRAFT_329082 [Trichoderma longibrachiatum ATCC 18648]|uniref:Uncharacterized protein n=1 Tax=Trichoderma longibrachiatum ATCC 18648 TaxID=983965 RepID=A0A2T4C2I3_TRILO|nr:hypothetical protein M440DRAFT_329082 [Trichoderma longibrachiatum ATCC 18648]